MANIFAIFKQKFELRERSSFLSMFCLVFWGFDSKTVHPRGPPLCSRPLRATSVSVRPVGASRVVWPAGPVLDSSFSRFLQDLPGLHTCAKFSQLLQASAKFSYPFFLRICAPFTVALWQTFHTFHDLRSPLFVSQPLRSVGTPPPFSVGPIKLNNRTRNNMALKWKPGK